MSLEKCQYSNVLIALHKSEICREDREIWENFIANQNAIKEYYSKLFLDVHVDEEEGFAFLKSLNLSKMGDDESNHPRLFRRIPLSKQTTLLLVLLREALQTFDYSEQVGLVLAFTRVEIREMLSHYTSHRNDDPKFVTSINQAIDSVVSLGCLKAYRDPGSNSDQQRFEVRRIIKARLAAEQLQDIKNKLEIELAAAETFSIENEEDV